MAKPTIAETKLEFASTDMTDPGSGQPNKAETSATKKTNGWVFLEKPPFNWMNYWMNLVYLYIKWIVQEVIEGAYTFAGVKTFSSIPVLPGSNPTTDNQAARKKYVDDGLSTIPNIIGKLGNGLNIAGSSSCGLTALSTVRVAWIDSNIHNLRTYDFDGTDWAQVGNSLNIAGGIVGTQLAALSSNRVAFIDNTVEDLRTYDFDGTDWAQVGNSLNIATLAGVSITALSSSRIALFGAVGGVYYIRTYNFDGTDWAQVGNSLNIGSSSNITSLSSSRIALTFSNTLRTYDFDGTNWAQVGNSFTLPSSYAFAYITSLSGEVILLMESDTDYMWLYNFNGTDWVSTGNKYNRAGIGPPSVTTLTSSRVSIFENVGANLETYHITWGQLAPYQTIL